MSKSAEEQRADGETKSTGEVLGKSSFPHLCPSTTSPSSLYYFAQQSHSEQAEQNDVNMKQETVLNLVVVMLILNVEPA